MTKEQFEMLKVLLTSASEDEKDPLYHSRITGSDDLPDSDGLLFFWVTIEPDNIAEELPRYTYAAQCFVRVLQELQKVKTQFPEQPEIGVDLGIGGGDGYIDPEGPHNDDNYVPWYNTLEIILG